MESLENAQKLTEFDVYRPVETLPVQTKQNLAVLGRQSSSNFPVGARGGANVTEYQFAVQNSNFMVLSNTDLCFDIVATLGAEATNAVFRGAHVLFKSITASLDNHNIINIQNYADRVADFVVQSQHTKDELEYYESIMALNKSLPEDTTTKFSVRVPLKFFGGEIGTLLPTGSLTTSLRISATVNDKIYTMFSGNGDGSTAPKSISILLNNMRLESEFVELQPTVKSKILGYIQSAKGMVIPYHSYAVDTRSIPAVSSLNQRISMSFNNVVSMYQLPYNVVKLPVGTTGGTTNLYGDIRWNAENMDEVSSYLVKFEGSGYYNLNSSVGQTGKASHAKALMDSLRTENTIKGAGGQIVKGIDGYQVLSVNFVRSNNVLSPTITDSGINAKLFSSSVETSALFNSAVTADKALTTIIKHTSRIIFKTGGFAIVS